MIKKEINIFFTALMFYTRIPCPKWIDHNQVYLNKATRYFPLIGYIVAGISTLVFYISHLLLPIDISIILTIAAGILTTGAFHEDGFADTCDGFGGGWTQEKILNIMKDSRSGAYGVIGSILILLMKYTTLVHIAEIDVCFLLSTLFLSYTLSRFAAVFIIFTEEYVREDELSKAKPIAKKMSIQNFFIAGCWVVPSLIIMPNFWYSIVLVPVLVCTIFLKKYYKKWIGGYTGDCLGAAQQINEIVILLTSLSVWKFIS